MGGKFNKLCVVLLAAVCFAYSVAAPLNDDFESSVAIVTLDEGSNTEATAQSGEPSHAGEPASASVWWQWTPDWTGTYIIDTLDSDFDTVLAVYVGDTVSNLTEVASSQNFEREVQSRVRVQAVKDVTYRIAVDGESGGLGMVRLRVRSATAADSDFRNGPNVRVVPSGVDLRTGDGVVLSALVNGKQVLRHQWYRQFEQLTEQTNATLMLQNVSLDDTGFYTVKTYFSDGSWQHGNAFVDVKSRFGDPASEVVIEPQVQVLNVGESSEWTSRFSGMTPEGFQWKLNGAPLADQTSSYLELPPQAEAGVFRYQLDVQMATGVVSSAEAILYVFGEGSELPVSDIAYISDADRPGRHVQSLVTFENLPMTLMVQVIGEEIDAIQWWKDGVALPNQTNTTFAVASLQLSDAGRYHVTGMVAGSLIRTKSSQVTVGSNIIVIRPPVISVSTDTDAGDPVNGIVPIGGEIRLHSTQRSIISRELWAWHKGSKVLATTTVPTFTIPDADPSDAGSYWVREYTTWGYSHSGLLHLQVVEPVVTNLPRVVRQPSSLDVLVGDRTMLSIAVSKEAPSFKQWYKDGVPLFDQNDETLVFPEVDLVQSGEYWCVVGNALGTVTSEIAEVRVHMPPRVFPVSDVWYFPGESFEISAGSFGTGSLAYQWIRDGESIETTSSAIPVAGAKRLLLQNTTPADTGRTLLLENLQLESEGTLSVGVGNEVGAEFSDVAHLRPLPPVPSYPDWVASHWPGETNAAVVGDFENPDGDTMLNYVEFALGSDPSMPDVGDVVGQLAQPVYDEGALCIEFPVRIAESNLLYRLRTTTNLVDWTVSCTYRPDGSQANRTAVGGTTTFWRHRYEPPYIFVRERVDLDTGETLLFSLQIERLGPLQGDPVAFEKHPLK